MFEKFLDIGVVESNILDILLVVEPDSAYQVALGGVVLG